MTEALALLVETGQAWLADLFLVFLRVGGVMAVLPAFGEMAIPPRVRFALAAGFTIVVAPALAGDIPVLPDDLAGQVATGGAEMVNGLLLGIALRLFVLALQTAGTMAAQSVSLSQIFGGGAGLDPQPAISLLLTMSGLALAVIADLHVHVASALIASYDVLPAGEFPDAGMLADWGVASVANAFGLAFELAAPFIVASLLYNVALGVINRAMPQLMVSFVGAPALTWGGLAVLLLAAPSLLEIWLQAMLGFLADPMGGPI